VLGFVTSSPSFRGDGEVASNFAKKCDGALIQLTCCSQTVQRMKTGKYSFKRGIIALLLGENYASLPLPKRGELVVHVSVLSVAITLLSFASWRHCGADSALLWRMSQ